MSSQKQLDRRRWFATLFIVGAILAYTLCSLALNLASLQLVSAAAIIALAFTAIFATSAKRTQQLVKRAVDYESIKESTRAFYILRNIALAIITLGVLVFPGAVRFLPSEHLAYFVVAFVAMELMAGAVFAIALVKTSRKWGIAFPAILAISAVIGLAAALVSHLRV